MVLQRFMFVLATVIVVGSMSVKAVANNPPTAEEIVAAADKVRNSQQPFRVSLSLVEYRSGQAHDTVNLAVHSKLDTGAHQYKILVRYTAPARDVGKLVLFNGGTMWFYDPASKASIRISAQQRLIGQASNGDVLTVNLEHDYTARIVGEESIQDADHQARNTWHLDLTASPDGNATYTRLETWIERDTFRSVKTKFYSDSGRLLKLAYYRRYEAALGGARPTEIIIADAVDTHLVTKVTYSAFHPEEIQDTWFQRDYLPRFIEE
jgi:outer membrane lipoprotein-sorting protein